MSRAPRLSLSAAVLPTVAVAVAVTAPLATAADPVSTTAQTTPTRVGVDAKKQVSFSMTGRDLTVTLRPVDGQENKLVRDLENTEVVVACQGTSPTKKKLLIADASTTWAEDALSAKLRLSKDVSVKPKWCVLERPQGTDLAVTFKLRIVKPAA